ncbi:DUF3293 domain-containing protein [Helicobacter pylori]|nr:DUF3293 domain-containing protein [Helicobacter pylori]
MLLNYDFLEFVDDEPKRNTSLTASIDKALADKKLARQNKPRVKIKDNLSLRATLDAFGEELSRLKREQNTQTIKGSTEERELLIEVYKSGYSRADADKITQYWQDKSAKIDLHKPIKSKDFFKGNTNIYRTFRNLFGQKFMDRYTALNSKATMKDFMSSDKFVKKYRYTQKDNMKRTRQLKSLLDSKRHFLGYIQVIGYWKENPKDDLLPDKETSFFVFTNEPSSAFDLASYLLLLARLFNQAAICYCDNAKTDKVELVSALPNDFGEVWAKFTDITFSVSNDLPKSLTRLKNKVYTFFEKKNMENYGVSFEELSTTKLKAMGMPKDIEEFNIPCKAYIERHIKTSIYSSLGVERNYPGRTFDMDKIQQYELQAIKRLDLQRCSKSKSFKASYNHNIKVNNLVKAMRQGKKVSRTLIAKVLANTIDTDAGYCFISDLATQLNNISPRLSKSIVLAIEQAQGIRLNYALIDKVSYNSLHNILSFVFDIDNPLSDQVFEELVIEVPREALKNVKLPQIKNVLTAQIFDRAYHFKS